MGGGAGGLEERVDGGRGGLSEAGVGTGGGVGDGVLGGRTSGRLDEGKGGGGC